MVGVDEGNRRLACLQTTCAFDPDATTFRPTMAMYWPAKRERSARMKKSNSALDAFFRRRVAIHLPPFMAHLIKPSCAGQPQAPSRRISPAAALYTLERL